MFCPIININFSMRRLFDFLPSAYGAAVPYRQISDSTNQLKPSLSTIVPSDPNKPYDMKHVSINKTHNKTKLTIFLSLDYSKNC